MSDGGGLAKFSPDGEGDPPSPPPQGKNPEQQREKIHKHLIMVSTETNLMFGSVTEPATRPGCNEPLEKMEKLEQDLQKARGRSKPILIIIWVKFESS